VTSARRSASLPEVPTAAETGLPGYETTNWHGIFATQNTPAAAVARLEAAAMAAVRSPATRARLVQVGVEPAGNTGAELASFWDAQLTLWLPIVRNSGATPD